MASFTQHLLQLEALVVGWLKFLAQICQLLWGFKPR